MKILAFSDWRAQSVQDAIELAKRQADLVDVIVYGGDDIDRFMTGERNDLTELAKYCKAGVLLAVAGNDDNDEQKKVLEGRNVRDLWERPFVFGDTAFIGVEGSTGGPGSLRHSERAVRIHLAALRKKIRKKRLVLVSHPPPYGILDRGIRFAELDTHDHHIGSKAVLDFVATNPTVKLVICGHCHSHGGQEATFKQALVVNVASHDNVNAEGRMAVIDLDAAETDVQVSWLSTRDLISPDSVLHLHQVGIKTEMKLRRVGLHKISALASCDIVAASDETGLGLKVLETLHFQAVAHQKNTIVDLAPFNLDLKQPMYLDIETDMGQKNVWLVGVLWDGNYHRFYADSWDDEGVMLLEFLDFLTRNNPSVLISYSCTNFDRRVLLKALRNHKLDESQRFGNIAHIDLGSVLKRCFAFPIKERKAKAVGEYLRYPFKHRSLNGMRAVGEYQMHIQERRPLDPAVFEYNEDDVRVLAHIVEKLSNISKGPLSAFDSWSSRLGPRFSRG